MKQFGLFVLAAATAMYASGAFADPAATNPTPSAAANSAPVATANTASPSESAQTTQDLNEVICEAQAPPTGSLLGGGQICKTRRQWNAIDKNTSIGQELHREVMGPGPM